MEEWWNRNRCDHEAEPSDRKQSDHEREQVAGDDSRRFAPRNAEFAEKAIAKATTGYDRHRRTVLHCVADERCRPHAEDRNRVARKAKRQVVVPHESGVPEHGQCEACPDVGPTNTMQRRDDVGERIVGENVTDDDEGDAEQRHGDD